MFKEKEFWFLVYSENSLFINYSNWNPISTRFPNGLLFFFFIVSNARFSFYFKSYDFKSDVHISSTRLVRNERARVSFLLFFLPPFMFCVGFYVHSKVEQHLSEMANNFPRQREEWPRQRLISLPFCSFWNDFAVVPRNGNGFRRTLLSRFLPLRINQRCRQEGEGGGTRHPPAVELPPFLPRMRP